MVCRTCNTEKDISEFELVLRKKKGLVRRRGNCIKCETKRKRIYHEKNPEKLYAKNVIAHLIEEGKLIPPEHCSSCGEKAKLHAHHDNYSKPKDVRWLCTSCHGRYHESIKMKKAV